MDEWTLRLPRIDNEASFVLARITRNGSLPLDLKIEATEGDYPYIGYLKQSTDRLGQPAKSYHGTAEEWRTMLTYGLSQEGSDPTESNIVQGLEVVAQVASSGGLAFVFRRNIGGITQRIGTVTLDQDNDLELSIFDWACQAIGAARATQSEMSSVRSRNAELQKIIDGLQVELNDLVKMKGEHEDMLLTKFQQILNSKKLKIRDQQRLLAGARVDPAVAAEVQQSRNMLRSRNAESSRSAKRSAETATEESENEEDASDAEARGKTHEENERMDMSPSDRSDEGATEDEEDETEGFTPSSSNLQNRRQGRRRKVSEDKANTEKEESFQGTKEVPPRRELPFARREQHAARTDLGQSNKGSAEHEQENDETTDDEL